MKNAIVLALLLMRMVAEEIVKEAAVRKKDGFLREGTWLLVLGSGDADVQAMPNTKYQEPIFLVVA